MSFVCACVTRKRIYRIRLEEIQRIDITDEDSLENPDRAVLKIYV